MPQAEMLGERMSGARPAKGKVLIIRILVVP